MQLVCINGSKFCCTCTINEHSIFDRTRQPTLLLSDIKSGADFTGQAFPNPAGIPVPHTERVGGHGLPLPERGLSGPGLQ